MYTRVHNRMLCTQEYKAYFIVEAVKAFCISFGDSHYTLTSVKGNLVISTCYQCY